METCYKRSVPFVICPTNTWRHHVNCKGRSICNGEKIPTLDGWKTVGEIKEGDYLFDAFGKPTKVLEVFPQGKLPVYKITFKDGRTIKCSKDHLWSFNTLRQRSKAKEERQFFTKTVEEIEEMGLTPPNGNEYKIWVPYCKPVNYLPNNLPIDPYVLGVMLGDGSFRNENALHRPLQLSSKNEEIPNKIAKIMNWETKKSQGNYINYTYYFSYSKQQQQSIGHKNVQIIDFLEKLPELINKGSKDKFIPEDYMVSDYESRIKLLQGLLDTDGSSSGGRICFTTISEKLATQVQELVYSVGMSATIKIIEPRGFGKNNSYTVSIYGNWDQKEKLFTIKYKQSNIKDNDANHMRFLYNPIIKIEKLDTEEEMTCFLVDNEEHLFLVGDYIVTHNTRADKKKSMQMLIVNWYHVKVSEDESDAIGICKYVAETNKKKPEIVSWE